MQGAEAREKRGRQQGGGGIHLILRAWGLSGDFITGFLNGRMERGMKLWTP